MSSCGGFGLGVIDQVFPLKVRMLPPTATQKVDEVHETPYRTFAQLAEEFGLGVVLQCGGEAAAPVAGIRVIPNVDETTKSTPPRALATVLNQSR
jgi:hypothetical protein